MANISKITDDQREQSVQLAVEGRSVHAIASGTGLSQKQVRGILKEHRETLPPLGRLVRDRLAIIIDGTDDIDLLFRCLQVAHKYPDVQDKTYGMVLDEFKREFLRGVLSRKLEMFMGTNEAKIGAWKEILNAPNISDGQALKYALIDEMGGEVFKVTAEEDDITYSYPADELDEKGKRLPLRKGRDRVLNELVDRDYEPTLLD